MLSITNPTLPMTQAQQLKVRSDLMKALRGKRTMLHHLASTIEQSEQVTRKGLLQLMRAGFVDQDMKSGKWHRTTPSKK